jgi:hypothetical protein
MSLAAFDEAAAAPAIGASAFGLGAVEAAAATALEPAAPVAASLLPAEPAVTEPPGTVVQPAEAPPAPSTADSSWSENVWSAGQGAAAVLPTTAGEGAWEPDTAAQPAAVVDSVVASAPPQSPSMPALVESAAAAVVAQAAAAMAPADGDVPSAAVLSAEARRIIEQIAWEVVPELAETIIREEIQRLLKARHDG